MVPTHSSNGFVLNCWGYFPGGSVVKNPPAKQEAWVRSLGREDPLEKERKKGRKKGRKEEKDRPWKEFLITSEFRAFKTTLKLHFSDSLVF